MLPALKKLLAAVFYRPGSVRTILRGPGRGLRYRIFKDFGLAAIRGGWEPEAQQLMVAHVRSGGVAYDIGANFGMHALLLARLVGPSGAVYAFEPMPTIAEELRQNVALNGFTNVHVVERAVDARNGTAAFADAHHAGAGHLSHGETAERTVEAVTLDSFVYEKGNEPPTFIKIDIEGGESAALAGAERVLREAGPALLIDLHNPRQDVGVGEILARHGYSAIRTETGERIRDLSKGWPSPYGIWGQIFARR